MALSSVVSNLTQAKSHCANICNGFRTGTWTAERTKSWNTVTEHRAWRHTVGRISCLARAVIYSAGLTFQVAKTVIKGVVSIIVTPLAGLRKIKSFDSWTFRGVAKDAIVALMFADRIINSLICTVCAPPKPYWGFSKSVSISTESVRGLYHHGWTVEAIWDHLVKVRPEYSRIVFENDALYGAALKETPVTIGGNIVKDQGLQKLRDQAKAG